MLSKHYKLKQFKEYDQTVIKQQNAEETVNRLIKTTTNNILVFIVGETKTLRFLPVTWEES